MQFKKPTSLSDTFGGKFTSTSEQWVEDFLNGDEFYAIANDNTSLKYFRVFLKNGSYYSIPYSLLPVFIYLGDKLIIKAYGVFIIIKGKGLQIIESQLSVNNLLYLKESNSGIETDNKDVFIQSIEIFGKNLSPNLSEDEL